MLVNLPSELKTEKVQQEKRSNYFLIAVDRHEVAAFFTNPWWAKTSCVVSAAYKEFETKYQS